MRMRRVLRILVPTLLAAAIAPVVHAAAPPGAQYPWVQPNTQLPDVSYTQPPAWVPIAPAWTQATLPTTSYVWAQPGAWSAPTEHAQPAYPLETEEFVP